MPDLKAAAKRLRGLAKWRKESAFPELRSATRRQIVEEADVCNLAAQALEAWAWMAENGWRVEYDVEDRWCCTNDVFTRYYADTPLGAVLAAMEGERKDGL